MGRLKAIIFDVDGTLADTEKNGHLVACNEAFAQMGFDIHWSWEEFKDLLKIPGNARRMRLALSAHTSLSESEIDRIVPELFELKKELYLKRVGELPLYPGVARIIREAIDRGIRLAIVSVTHDDQILALLKAQIPEALDAFNPIFGRQSGTKNAALYARCAAMLGCDTSEILVIEDSEKGFKAAHEAGLACAVVYNEYTRGQDFTGAELVVRSLECLDLDLLERLCLG
ncbi:HAD-superfamily hydrolase [Candidatus Methylomirabilis lanthanidiphila]|uniref:HAD-superfamily hydrolase n=1 Tax=Candidatus Methylomirabilis lanthanidiphila TaxID=2211376 RepID=A0A564ZJT1_9BACT|nr:HAD-IA family hydrolase [Candidatus Methylomirabilis lanthanidiphila]VUZ85610.1 HAD-superfamily hydrolase [Candidatus Methylomirabilis lanthanidiphila]